VTYSPSDGAKAVSYQVPGTPIIEAAAWVAVARAIVNLPELITRN
jgi:hypothetical protein